MVAYTNGKVIRRNKNSVTIQTASGIATVPYGQFREGVIQTVDPRAGDDKLRNLPKRSAWLLQPGDTLAATGETVVQVSGVRGGKVTVTLRDANGRTSSREWNRNTSIAVAPVTSDLVQGSQRGYTSTPSRTGEGNGGNQGTARAGGEVPQPRSGRVDGRAGSGLSRQRPVVDGRPLAIVGSGPVRSHGHRAAIRRAGGSTPPLFELDAKVEAATYQAAMARIKSTPQGAAVSVYSVDEYANMRLFMNATGTAGFALNGDELVSVWSLPENPDRGIGRHLTATAVSQGARRLDAFDTVLPALYATQGFVPVARIAFNDEYAPDGWDYEFYRNYNGGRPDVVFMRYDPSAVGGKYTPGSGQYVDDYDEGIELARRDIDPR